MFPKLEALVLAECPIARLPTDGQYSSAFPCLKYLSLNASKVADWASVYAINSFPKLSELRLHNCPLYEVSYKCLTCAKAYLCIMYIRSCSTGNNVYTND